MRVAFVDFVLDPAQPGAAGLSNIVWSMARELQALGDEVHIVAPYTTDRYPYPGIQVHRFGIPPIGYRNIVGHLLIVLRAWRELRAIAGLDIVHAPEYFSTGVLSLLPLDARLVLTVPGNIYERIAHGNPYDAVTTQAYKITSRLSARRCSAVIAISEEMAVWWTRTGVPPQRLHLLPLGVDRELFHPREDARQSLQMEDDSFVLVYAGRLSPEKGIHDLLNAVAQLSADERQRLRLHLFGTGPQEERLLTQSRQLNLTDTVIWHGWAAPSTLALYYSAADAVVLPSYSEGMPRVMPEAMASGTLFIGTNISGVRDHVIDGNNGFLVQPGDVSSLADRLRQAMTDPDQAAELARRGAEYARLHFDWASITRRIRDEVYGAAVIPAESAHAVSEARVHD